MPSRCAITCCTETKKLHRIPSANKYPLLHNEWLIKCGREIKYPHAVDIRVCSKHFEEADFVDSKNKEKIRAGAVPSLFLGTPMVQSFNLVVKPSQVSPKYKVELPKLNLKLEINVQFDNTADSDAIAPKESNNELPSSSHAVRRKMESDLKTSRRICQRSRQIKKKYKSRCQTLLEKRKHMKTDKEVKALLRKAKSEVHTLYQNRLKTIFTTNQIKKLITSKRTRWTSEDIVSGLALRYKANTYQQLVNRNFPLPAVRTLRSWTQKFTYVTSYQPPCIQNINNFPCRRILCQVTLDVTDIF